MDLSRISRAGVSLLLFCCLVGGAVGVAGLAVSSVWADDAGQPPPPTDVADGNFDSIPTEDTQTTERTTPDSTETTTPESTATSTETASPTPTATEGSTPTTTPTDTPGSDDVGAGRSTPTDDANSTPEGSDGTDEAEDSDRVEDSDRADDSDGTDAPEADAESRDPSDFEEAAEGDVTDDTTDSDAVDDVAGESRDDAPQVEAWSRSRMPTRGPERGTIVVAFDDVPVSTISFTRRQYGNVSVGVLDGLPPGVEVPTGDRLSTLRITVPSELRGDPATVRFTVDVTTLDAQGIPNDAVWLAHHDPDTGAWDRLQTHVVHASDGRVVYAAETPGFSLFAIQGDGSRVRSSTPTEVANGSGTGAANVTAADEAEAAFLGGFGFSMGVVLFMGATSVATTVLGARRVSRVERREED